MKRQLSIAIFVLLTTFFSVDIFGQNETSIDSLSKSYERLKETLDKNRQLGQDIIPVQIIQTCSTQPNLCGTMAFGSLSMVKILTGDFSGDTIYVASLCHATFYIHGQVYNFTQSFAPNFSVHLCNGAIYNNDWNYQLEKTKFYLAFGELKKK